MNILRILLACAAGVIGVVVLIPLVAVTLPIWCVALLTKGIRRLIEPKAVPWEKVIEYCPSIGWKPKPNLDTHCSFAAGLFHSQTGADGWPGHTTLEQSDLIVIGDSYAFGFGVDSKRAFFKVNRDLRIKAIGSPGYNMVQEVMWMKALAPRLKGKLVIWWPFFGNDLYDNLLPNLYQYRMPFVRQDRNGAWEIVNSHVRPEEWPFNYEKNAREEEKFHGVFGENVFSNRVYSACEFLIREGRDTCRNAGADLVVMTVPWAIQFDDSRWAHNCAKYGKPEAFDRNAPDRKIAEICAKVGVPLVEARRWLELQHHYPNEGHWTNDGHRRISNLLTQVYRQYRDVRLGDGGSVEPVWSDPHQAPRPLTAAQSYMTARQR